MSYRGVVASLLKGGGASGCWILARRFFLFIVFFKGFNDHAVAVERAAHVATYPKV
jgi:hypothetical protein